MSDVFSKAKRSKVMSLIRSRGNKATEVAFMKLLRCHKISGWRRHTSVRLTPRGSMDGGRRPFVKPDFVFKGRRIAVFIDGCFWHGCPSHGTKPVGNAEFWHAKLAINRARDRFVTKMLRRRKWSVVRIWEHQLSQGDRLMMRLQHRFARTTLDLRGTDRGRGCPN
jgi:DNA mismatch endonuclease (patch repair protein)